VTARVMSHDVLMIGSEVCDFNLDKYRGTSYRTTAPYSPSSLHLPGRSTS